MHKYTWANVLHHTCALAEMGSCVIADLGKCVLGQVGKWLLEYVNAELARALVGGRAEEWWPKQGVAPNAAFVLSNQA